MSAHFVQTKEWSDFKNAYGTKSIHAGGVYYTKHAIPFSGMFYAYCPKVKPEDINFEELKTSLKDNECVAINFDVPDVLVDQDSNAKAIFEKECVPAHKTTFAEYNILLDLTPSEDEILARMHEKHRYNIKYALKKGVTVKKGNSQEDFDGFYKLLSETSDRQKYFIHPKKYYQLIWDSLHSKGKCEILTTYFENEPLASWMLFVHEDTLYYPYGGSSEKYKNVFGSILVGWEAIKLGKSLGCKVFDMWGAAASLTDTSDSWHGFTNFKMKFGGKHVKYMNSYDLVINSTAYQMFNLANDIRWGLLRAIK